MGSPYEILGVDADADEETIKAAYRSRVKEVHPDQGGTPAEFRRVKQAYEVIQSDDWDGTGAWDGADGWTSSRAGVGTEPGTPGDDVLGEARVEYLDYEVLADYGWSLEDPELFEKAEDADLTPGSYGEFLVQPDETLLEAAENRGFAWPYACRGGACANCAIAVVEGELGMPVDHILPSEMMDRGIRLSCNGIPITDRLKVVYNVKHMAELDDLRLPPHPFERAHADD